MEEQALRETIAQRIAFFRRQAGQTQAELAETLNYSDKSVSKWERAEGVPDIYVLVRIAALYGVTVNDLIAPETPQPAPRRDAKTTRVFVTLLSLGLVWLTAAAAFFAVGLIWPDAAKCWLCFVWAFPVCAVVLVVFAALWRGWLARGFAVSLLTWTLAAGVAVTVPLRNIEMIYVVAGVFEALCVLWTALRLHGAGAPRRKAANEKRRGEGEKTHL